MPGLGGFVRKKTLSQTKQTAFSQAMLWDTTYREHSFYENNLFLNAVSNARVPVSGLEWKQRYLSFLYGELYPAQAYQSPAQRKAAHTRLLKQFLSDAPSTLAHTPGAFLLSIYDRQTQTLYLANDTLGLYPLHYMQTDSLFAFSSQTEALLRLLPKRELNPSAFGQWLTMGTILNGATHFKDIHRLQPGRLLTFDGTTLKVERYLKVAYGPSSLPLNERIRQADDLFLNSVTMRHVDSERSAVALSGGFDSRAVWAVYLGKKLPAGAATRGLADSADMQIASQITSALHIPHEQHYLDELDVSAFPDWAESLTRFSEGWMNVKSALLFPYYSRLQTKFDVLIDASGGALLRRQHARSYGTPAGGTRQLEPYTFRLYRQPALIQNLLQTDFRHEAEAQALRAVSDFYEANKDIGTPEDRLDHFYLEQVCGIKGGADLLFQSHFIHCRQPFYDQDLLELSRRFSVSERKALHLHRSFIERFYPPLRAFPLESNDYAIPYRGFRFRRLAPLVWERIVSRFHVPAEHLPGPKKFPLWNAEELFRGPLLAYARDILLDPRTLQRSFWKPEGIQHLVNQAQNGQGSVSSALFQLLTVELFMRHFVDLN